VGALSRTLYAFAVLAAATPFAQAQLVTENAGIVSSETPILREAFGFTQYAHGHDLVWSHRFSFALDRRDELQLTLPFHSRELEQSGGDADFAGFGDATLRWKHALWREDDVMLSDRWSFLAEITAPTGDGDDTADGFALPPDAQLSRGDWTFGAGTAFTHIHDRERFAAELLYRHRTAHEGVQLGAAAELNLAYWYRLAPASFTDLDGVVEVRGVVELLSTYRWDTEVGSASADDSGAFVRLAPGVQVFPRDWMLFEAGVELPLVQSLDDSTGDEQFALRFAIKFLF
jgi:hypothetical protein